jgi:hypothetical protein
VCLWAAPLTAQSLADARAALAAGDTTFALETLRTVVTTRSRPEGQCLLATVLTRSATSHHADWKDEAFAAGGNADYFGNLRG